MDTFTGRFSIQNMHASKAAVNDKDTGTTRMRPCVQVGLAAVYGGTPADDAFHLATPAGRVELTITNPMVAEFLEGVWHDYVTTDEPYPAPGEQFVHRAPRFEVTFRLMGEDED